MADHDAPVWFITGCSSGFGRELVKQVLARGWKVVATARDPAKVADLVQGFEEQALAVPLDVRDAAQVDEAVARTLERFGRIDVLVNNAGYGYQSSVEEGEDGAIRAMFETNVFGLAGLIRRVLPVMRAQRSGFVVNFSSMAGISGNPGTGYYAASKFAVEGLSDALAKEVADLGITVLLVEPGPFRTEFRTAVQREESRIADYEATVGARLRAISHPSTAPGNPIKAAQAVLAAVTADKPPARLLLGRLALQNARDKLASMQADFAAWEAVTLGADDR
ncbi:oxidoreductase [Ancylobacter mangrovi]|uniref:oxidoreductase n=1 Tax=Ancylobacter mangrovi TaxID=2972472 RepID=UPI00216381E2|nr:oxidoreductase [Ancylobacter mangrovi]MCS0500809.1 oxidoreductase [Ancylobacter mangrovi]